MIAGARSKVGRALISRETKPWSQFFMDRDVGMFPVADHWCA
jgi:hypothetical protein